MEIDATAVSYGLVGLAAGVGMLFWNRKAELEERCEFLEDMSDDLEQAFAHTGEILDDKNTPPPIRKAILFLLAGHSDQERGKKFAILFLEAPEHDGESPPDQENSISKSMENLAKANPALARKTHHVLASLTFGLFFLNMADSIKVAKVKDETAKDPTTLWERISSAFRPRNDNEPPAGHGLLHVR